MTEELFKQLPLFLAIGAVCLCVVILIILLNQRKKLETSLTEVNAQLTSVTKSHNSLKKQFVELRTASINMGHRLVDVNELQQNTADRISELEFSDADSRLYSRANKLVKLGAGINELMEECELPKAEAELMMSLQSKLTGKESMPPLRPDKKVR
ncbi:DUF2802 domain-containing protein [Aliivibrio kagoshimensis]|uniref:DUF2802 domain-containing protein n=1 Tax=Aliivibrio kagoshimensis TaxID=2910230 RepID=UPI003D0C9B36